MKALADHPVAWCKDYEGGRSFYTNVGANGDFSGADVRSHLAGALQWTAGEADPVYSDCGATVLANYQQTKISVTRRTSTSRSASTCCPTAACCRPRAAASCACTTRRTAARRSSPRCRSTRTARTGSTGRRSTTTSPTNHWVYLYYSPQTVVNVKQSDGTTKTITTPPNELGADRRAVAASRGTRTSGYFQLSRFKFVDGANADARPRERAEDPARLQQPRRVLPRRAATSTSTRTTTCGWSRATTRRPAAATRAASRRTTT